MRFHLPTEILFGPGVSAELERILREKFQSRRTLLVTDRGVVDAGIVGKIANGMGEITVFDEVEPNPRHTTIDRGGALAREIDPDCVVGLGGGSSLDASKAIAVLATNPGPIEDFEGRDRYRTAPLPVVAIPTTCGTGSEVTWVSVISHTGRKFKMSIKGQLMYPAVALVDPDLLASLPRSLVASTGLDALTHAIEAYTSRPASFITNALALESLRLIFRHLPRSFKDIAGDGPAREAMMMGSLLAGMAFGNSDVGAVHCLAESLGSVYDIPHGVANAVLLPSVMEFNLEVAVERYAEIAAVAGVGSPTPLEASRNLIRKVRDLCRELSIPEFQELGIPEDDYPTIARKSFENNSNPSNPREARVEDYTSILENASRPN